MKNLTAVEICAGAGGQSLGLHLAGFEHVKAIELDQSAADTLAHNLKRLGSEADNIVAVGDVADPAVWNPADFEGVALLAGGVPCPPFSIAGKQTGSADERDLFAWSIELSGRMKPKAILLENVRGLSMPRFASYRQWVKDRLSHLGYWSDWKLLEARDFGVPQLRPRFVLVALQREYAPWFSWPKPNGETLTVGDALGDLMGARGWPGAEQWAQAAQGIGPTIVGGSKKHGGADLGPTRAKRAWEVLRVDGRGVADEAPGASFPLDAMPRLTTEMVARIQGWGADGDYAWDFLGKKTSVYRQIGNAFPPPVARAIGDSIARAIHQEGTRSETAAVAHDTMHDAVYAALSSAEGPMSIAQLLEKTGGGIEEVEARLRMLERDFELLLDSNERYALGNFKAFVGQDDHVRHEAYRTRRSAIS